VGAPEPRRTIAETRSLSSVVRNFEGEVRMRCLGEFGDVSYEILNEIGHVF
jgi:hypothetical protein